MIAYFAVVGALNVGCIFYNLVNGRHGLAMLNLTAAVFCLLEVSGGGAR